MKYQCPPTHKHGQNTTCYHTCGCRCEECTTAAAQRENRRMRLKAYGRYRGRIPARGVIRRIQGLYFLGWTTQHIADLSGIQRSNISHYLHRKWSTPETYDLICDVYRTLVLQGAGPSKRTQAIARRNGWVSPFAWEDIDNDEDPVNVKDPDRGKFDPVAVELAVSGQPNVPLNFREREEVIRRLNARRWSDGRIARIVNCDSDTVYRIRRRLGLPAWAYHERAADYDADERMNAA